MTVKFKKPVVRCLTWEGERERERERQRETERDRERQTDRQSDIIWYGAIGERDRETETERDRETEKQRQRETERQRETKRDRDRERQRERQRDRERQGERHRDRQTADRQREGSKSDIIWYGAIGKFVNFYWAGNYYNFRILIQEGNDKNR